MTEQHHAQTHSVAALLARFGVDEITKTLTETRSALNYYDTSALTNDYQEAQNLIAASDQAFMTLPAAAREKFNHDPALFMQAASSPTVQEDLLNLGVVYDGNRHLLESADSSLLDTTVRTDTNVSSPTPEEKK